MNIFQGLCICLLALQVALQSETRQVSTGWVWPWQDVPQYELVTDYEASFPKVMEEKESTLNQRSWRAAHANNNYLQTAGLTALTGGLAVGTGVVGKKAFATYKALQQAEKNMEKDPENSDLQKKVARARRKFYAAVFFTLVLGGATGFVGYKGLLPSFRQTRKMWYDNEILRKPLQSLYDIKRRREKAEGVAGPQLVYQISEVGMRNLVKPQYYDRFDTLATEFKSAASTVSSETQAQPVDASAKVDSAQTQGEHPLLTESRFSKIPGDTHAREFKPAASTVNSETQALPIDPPAKGDSAQTQGGQPWWTANPFSKIADEQERWDAVLRFIAYKNKRRVALLRFTAKHLDPKKYIEKNRPRTVWVPVSDPTSPSQGRKEFQSPTVTRKDPKAALKQDQKRLRAAADVLELGQQYKDAIALLERSNAGGEGSPIEAFKRTREAKLAALYPRNREQQSSES